MGLTWILLAATTVTSVQASKDLTHPAVPVGQVNFDVLPSMVALDQNPNPAFSSQNALATGTVLYLCGQGWSNDDHNCGAPIDKQVCEANCACYNGAGRDMESCDQFLNCHADTLQSVCSELPGGCTCYNHNP